MKTLTYSQLKRLINESLLMEDKTKMINKLVLPDINDENEKEEYKQELISFFKSHSNYENKVDWNKAKTLTKKDFDSIMRSAETSKSNIKRQVKAEIEVDLKNIFRSEGDKKFKFVYENENWLFVSPLSYEAAVFCDSSINQGAGAKWCIGYEKDDSFWNNYTEDGSSFIMAFNKHYKDLSPEEKQANMKYMIQLDEDNEIHIWNQPDDDIGSNVKRFGISLDQAEQMFASVKNDFAAIKKDKNKKKYGEPIEVGENSFVFHKDGVLTKYIGSATDIVIPNGVTSIGDWAFDDCETLTSITIPSSVTSIGYGAFACSGLKSVAIPEGVTHIKNWAFARCESLTSVMILEGVMSIGDYVFRECGSLTSVTIPSSVKSIGDYAFQWCERLRAVTIPSSVTNIGERAFGGCSSLKSMTIPDSVTSIGSEAFFDCKKLTKLKAPWSLIKKNLKAFKGCPVYDQIKAKNK